MRKIILIGAIGLVAGVGILMQEPAPDYYVQTRVTFVGGKPMRPMGPPVVLRSPEELRRAAERRAKQGSPDVKPAAKPETKPVPGGKPASDPKSAPPAKKADPARKQAKDKEAASPEELSRINTGAGKPKQRTARRTGPGRDADGLLRPGYAEDDPAELSKISPGTRLPERRQKNVLSE